MFSNIFKCSTLTWGNDPNWLTWVETPTRYSSCVWWCRNSPAALKYRNVHIFLWVILRILEYQSKTSVVLVTQQKSNNKNWLALSREWGFMNPKHQFKQQKSGKIHHNKKKHPTKNFCKKSSKIEPDVSTSLRRQLPVEAAKVWYSLQLSNGRECWVVTRRYSEFLRQRGMGFVERRVRHKEKSPRRLMYQRLPYQSIPKCRQIGFTVPYSSG